MQVQQMQVQVQQQALQLGLVQEQGPTVAHAVPSVSSASLYLALAVAASSPAWEASTQLYSTHRGNGAGT
jgi:hypothetical protein